MKRVLKIAVPLLAVGAIAAWLAVRLGGSTAPTALTLFGNVDIRQVDLGFLAKAGATQGTFTTSEAIPWKPVDPKHPGLMMFVVWGDPNTGASEILQQFPAGMDSGWHWHTAAYQGVVIQGKFTHTFKGAAPQTGGPGSVWSQPARQVHDDKCEEGGDCIVLVYFHGKLDFKPVDMKAQ